MKINYISSFASEEIETPDDENGFYRQLAKKMASEQPPCTVKIQTPYGNASYNISNRSGTILIQESSNNIVFPDSAQCSEYPTVYLTCVNGEKNNYKFYKLEKQGESVIASYGRIGAAKGELFSERSCEYPLRMFWIKYEEKLAKGYEDKTHIYIDEAAQPEEKPAVEEKSSNPVSVALYQKLLRHAKQMIQKSCASLIITEGMITESKRLLNILYTTKRLDEFNNVLKELLAVCPRKVWKVDGLLAVSSEDIPKIIQREEDLVMAMQVATGKNTFNDTSDNFQKKNIIVTEASKEKRERVLELLTPDLRLKVLNIYRVIPKEQEKKFKQYVKDRNISEIKSLWHGSRNENWLSIAKNGLMLHPNAAITGKMFGNGIYFASSAKKSWGYTSGGFWTREMSSSTRFMGLYATAYGNPLNVTSPSNYSEKSIGNFNCVHAHAGNYLRNDEIIFYNEAAMLLTYLVEFSA